MENLWEQVRFKKNVESSQYYLLRVNAFNKTLNTQNDFMLL
jgi:hypothetical protein